MIALKLTSTLIFTAALAACASKMPLSESKPAAPVAAAPTVPAAPAGPALIAGNFQCELGNRVQVSADAQRPNAINLAWKGRSYPLQAVSTSTGALRYEDADSGHVWIQIPAKSMLLNAKAGQQLANECKTR
ncbi:MliC family protein, partial [Herminiimonas sp. CN]|uniref:MliC family protein n=1 Tax=Herminiimonas sp. CN TaxID=1349818 RepID=UPI0004742465